MCSVWELCITLTRWLPFPLTHSNISKFILFSRIASLIQSADVASEVNQRNSAQARWHTSEKSTLALTSPEVQNRVSLAPRKGIMSSKMFLKNMLTQDTLFCCIQATVSTLTFVVCRCYPGETFTDSPHCKNAKLPTLFWPWLWK